MKRFGCLCFWLALICWGGMPTGGAAQAPDALYEEAQRYHMGDGVLQDYGTAAKLLEQAADAGHGPAQNMLGRYYFEGLGVAQDINAAIRHLEAAAAQGAPEHVVDLARVLETMPETLPRAVALFTRAAEAGHADAAVSLGVLYQEGRGVAQDFTRARQLYEGPAAAGHARALNNLGLLFVRGHGVQQDYPRAATLFAAAAEKGLKQALTNLGVLYENGFGVPLDEARAAELYRAGGLGTEKTPGFVWDARIHTVEGVTPELTKMALSGDPIARLQWAWLVLAESEEFDARRQASAFVSEAARQGHGPSMHNLGLLYMRGIGVPQDFVSGLSWLILAKAQGVTEAEAAIAHARAQMTAGQVNAAQIEAKRLGGD